MFFLDSFLLFLFFLFSFSCYQYQHFKNDLSPSFCIISYDGDVNCLKSSERFQSVLCILSKFAAAKLIISMLNFCFKYWYQYVNIATSIIEEVQFYVFTCKR